jgi:hypothetical protein
MSDDDEPVNMGNLELYEGDVSVVLRADGEVEFLVACDDEESEEYVISIRKVRYLKFVLESDECQRLFERSLIDEVN